MKNRRKQDNRGFSLVELIIAIAILAFVVAPILRAFVSSARTNNKAQRMLSATTVAQNVMEEVKGTAFKTLIKAGTDKEVDDTQKAKGKYTITYKNLEAGGKKYTATVKLDAQEYKAASEPEATVFHFNDKEQAQIFTMDSKYDGSYMPVKDAAKLAADALGTSEDNIKRETTVEIKNVSDGYGGDILSAQVLVAYSYNGKTYNETTNSYIYRNASGKAGMLRSLYIFFEPLYSAGGTPRETITINNEALAPVTVYLIKQEAGTPDAMLEKNYRVDVKVNETGRPVNWTSEADYKPLTTIRTNLKFEGTDANKWQIQLKQGAGVIGIQPKKAYHLSTLESKVVEDKLYKVEVVVKDEDNEEVAKMEGTKDK